MNKFNYQLLIGEYYGEPLLGMFLSKVQASPPKLKKSDNNVLVECPLYGVELTFTSDRFLDVSYRDYPEGVLVLSGINFNEVKNDACLLELPAGLVFGMKKSDAIHVLGKPNWSNPKETLFRWDLERHCISVRIGANENLEMVGVQLPNRYTHN